GPIATHASRQEWSRHSDLNRGPAVYETAALPLSYVGPGGEYSQGSRNRAMSRPGRARRARAAYRGGDQPRGSSMADFIMLMAITASVFTGLKSGFVRRLAGLIFLGVSFVAGSYLRTPAGALLHDFFPKIPAAYADMVGYSVVFSALLLAFNLFS